MAKLTKPQLKAHNKAVELLELEHLTDNDKIFILENWHEATATMPTESGSFFTPFDLAMDFAIDACSSGRVLDVCAGIGALSFACQARTLLYPESKPDFTCVEINPKFVEIGKRILPEATWICADVCDLPSLNLGKFDTVISNPPFGRASRTGKGFKSPRYTGAEFEYKLIDTVADMANNGTFILPQSSSPFRYSGQCGYYRDNVSKKIETFVNQTGFYLEAGCGVDTEHFSDQWKTTNIITEICTIDFEDWRNGLTRASLQPNEADLFSQLEFA